jgi:tRNA threonylcarbamoyladenosine biosynthesis protein TsaE
MNLRREAAIISRQFKCPSPDDLMTPARYLIEHSHTVRIIAVYGHLGSGKTTFIKTVCRLLGCTDFLSSPGFSILNEYRLPDGSPIYHFDFYRIQDIGEVYDLGYEQFFYSGYYCFLEWPEKIPTLLPEQHIKVFIRMSLQERILTIEHYEQDEPA